MQTTSTRYQADFNFLNINSDKKLLGVGVGATNKVEALQGVELTFGTKLIWTNVGDNDYSALPLTAKIRYDFPPLMYNIPPVALEAKVLYAPVALSFGDSEKYSEFRVSGDIEMIKNVRVYAGYRNIHTGYKDIDTTLFDNSFYAGLKFIY